MVAPIVSAQEETMEARFYLLPMETVEINGRPIRRPAYVSDIDVQRSTLDYGKIDLALVAVLAETIDHEWLAIQDGVYPIPTNIDVNVPQANVSTLQSYLEARAVPGDWTSPSITWRETLRTISGMFLFMQRFRVISGGQSPLDWGITLNTQWRSLTTEQQSIMLATAISMGYDTAFITDNTLMRAILKEFADAWGDSPINFTFLIL